MGERSLFLTELTPGQGFSIGRENVHEESREGRGETEEEEDREEDRDRLGRDVRLS